VLLAWAFCAAALAAPQPYRLAPAPAWVTPAADAPLAQAEPVEAGDSDYLLVDEQIRLSAITEQYSRYVERMVNQASVDRAAQISIEFDPAHARLLVHEVRVFRDGRAIDKLATARRSLLNRESNLDEALINGRVTLHLLLQDVRVGDVLDYAYTIERTDPFGERGYNNSFITQWATPVRQVRVRVLRPAERTLQILDHSKLPGPAVTRRGAWVETTWEGSGIAALPREDARPPWLIFYPRIELSEFADWNAVRRWSQPMYAIPPKKDAALQALIAELEAEPDESARLLRALRFVQDDIRYTGIEIGAGAYRPTPPGEVLARRFGDCKDKVLLLVTLLRALGVEAYPALVNSYLGRGVAERLPGPGAFDHVIAKVRWKNRDYWLDATASGQGGLFDTTLQSNFGHALVLDSSLEGLATMPVRQVRIPNNHVVETYDLREGTRTSATLTVKTEFRDEEADVMRVRMRTQTASELGKQYLEYYRKTYPGIHELKPLALTDDRVANLFTLQETYQIDAPFQASTAGKRKFQLEAYLVSDRTGVPSQTDRTTPLGRRHPVNVQHEIVAYLPGQWTIDADEVKIADAAFEYHSTTGFTDGRLALDYQLRSTTDHVPVDDLRKFLVNLDKAHDDAYYTLTEGEDAVAGATQSSPGAASLPMVAAAIGGLGLGMWVAFWLAGLSWRLPPPAPDAPEGLWGWMVLPMIGVVISPIGLANNMRTWFQEVGTVATYEATAESLRWMLLLELGLLGVATSVSLITVWLLFKRVRTFPFAFIALQLTVSSVLVMDLAIVLSIGDSSAGEGHDGPKLMMRAVVTAIWITYVLVSQRVRATFVKAWNAEEGGASAPSAGPAPA